MPTQPPHLQSAGSALTTDFDLMLAVAGKTDARNDEIRAMLQSFVAAMSSVPPSVWGGVAATRFREVMERWNGESLKLHGAICTSVQPSAAERRLMLTGVNAFSDLHTSFSIDPEVIH